MAKISSGLGSSRYCRAALALTLCATYAASAFSASPKDTATKAAGAAQAAFPGGLNLNLGWPANVDPAIPGKFDAQAVPVTGVSTNPILQTDRFAITATDGWLRYRIGKDAPLKSELDAQTNGSTTMFVFRWRSKEAEGH